LLCTDRGPRCCTYFDAATAQGLHGRAAVVAYLEQLFPRMPKWRYAADEIWAIDGGFCARWYCDIDGGGRMRGFDFVKLRDGLIAWNEVYTHNL